MSEPTSSEGGLSRRAFLATGAAAGGLVLVGVAAPWATGSHEEHDGQGEPPPRFFTDAERVTVAAIVERLVPGSAGDPGAREAGVVDYIDRKLGAGGFAEPTFIDGPFVEVVEEGSTATPSGPLVVARSELYRYGYQSEGTPQRTYREGLEALDRFAQSQFDGPFHQLGEDDRDALLTVLDDIQQTSEGGDDQGTGASNEATGPEGGGEREGAARDAFGELSPGQFFSTLHADTMEGMFSDPSYGGNQDMVGWTLIGFPGPQRSYSPGEMLGGTRKRPQPHDHLPPMNPDRPDDAAREALEQARRGVKDG
ncbi:gluconate 2-dehydrogenase subunit 3 family protein [Aeromicrobium phragmitis]|uniref:Gluconate 2-dehydrogenase subunit 3 family protein n=1 Tax=Aeromicrobium phragmitis TaxID=2478914 RepID=A0A3L8PLP5_9ACTN|nr:gluconate 2-dehydrogenase subunit 3 family protein [Aeromicrobium phragmitis]RLV56271.1 gluconate 2-dehydrogenase subunit 3 family protein [Aeromicrobium phragmitis]